MRPPRPSSGSSDPGRLRVERVQGRNEWWTRAAGAPPAVYGERWKTGAEGAFRRGDPTRSKLAAALARGGKLELPRPGERWLYLGAGSGTTASHVADLVGEEGAVYALERSPRPALKLLRVAERYPNLLPVLADAHRPEEYLGLVPPADGLYVDVAQPDQVELSLANARLFLRSSGRLFLCLKTPSLGRERRPAEHLESARATLRRYAEVAPAVSLEPFHRGHYFLAARPTGALFRGDSGFDLRAGGR